MVQRSRNLRPPTSSVRPAEAVVVTVTTRHRKTRRRNHGARPPCPSPSTRRDGSTRRSIRAGRSRPLPARSCPPAALSASRSSSWPCTALVDVGSVARGRATPASVGGGRAANVSSPRRVLCAETPPLRTEQRRTRRRSRSSRLGPTWIGITHSGIEDRGDGGFVHRARRGRCGGSWSVSDGQHSAVVTLGGVVLLELRGCGLDVGGLELDAAVGLVVAVAVPAL